MNTYLKQVIERLSVLEQRTEEHLLEAGSVKTDIAWLKKMVWLLISVEVTALATIIAERIWR